MCRSSVAEVVIELHKGLEESITVPEELGQAALYGPKAWS
jgi:hypothetical protein